MYDDDGMKNNSCKAMSALYIFLWCSLPLSTCEWDIQTTFAIHFYQQKKKNSEREKVQREKAVIKISPAIIFFVSDYVCTREKGESSECK